jgi:hypothetical protein
MFIPLIFFSVRVLDNAMILYISRGLLSSLTDAREVMDVVSLHNARTGHKVIINTYAVIDGKFLCCCLSLLPTYLHSFKNPSQIAL